MFLGEDGRYAVEHKHMFSNRANPFSLCRDEFTTHQLTVLPTLMQQHKRTIYVATIQEEEQLLAFNNTCTALDTSFTMCRI